MQCTDRHIGRYKTAAKKHGKHEIKHYLIARLKSSSGQRISRRHGHYHIEHRACHHVNQCVQIPSPDSAVLNNLPVTVETNILRQKCHFTKIHQIGITDGRNDVGRILRTFKIKKNVEVTDNGKIII